MRNLTDFERSKILIELDSLQKSAGHIASGILGNAVSGELPADELPDFLAFCFSVPEKAALPKIKMTALLSWDNRRFVTGVNLPLPSKLGRGI